MRIAHVSIIHGPLDNRIVEKQCRTLADAGYEVHYVSGGIPAGRREGIRFHSLSERSVRPAARNQPRLLARAMVETLRLRAAVYHLHDAHLIPLGLLLKLTGAAVLYDVHEDYEAHARTKLAGRPVRGGLKALMWRALEAAARARFDAFLCASPALARRFPPARTIVVGNFPRHRDYELGPYRERPNTIMCSGNLSAIRAFPELVAALRLLPRELDVRLLAMGQLRNGAKRAQPGWERVDHVPWQPFPEVIRGMLRARIGVALLRPLPNHMDAIRSNKLFEYMAAGLPVVVSDLPEWRDIVLGVGCGLVVDPADPAAIAEALERLLTHPEEAEEMGLRGRAAVCDRFNWDGEGARLLSAYRRLLGEPAPRPEPEPEPARAPEPEPVAAK